MSPVEILAKAADRIENGKWVQGAAFGDGINTPVCMVGALDVIYAEMRNETSFHSLWSLWLAFQAIGREIGSMEEVSYGPLGRWNDEPGRTKEEVISTIRNAKRWL